MTVNKVPVVPSNAEIRRIAERLTSPELDGLCSNLGSPVIAVSEDQLVPRALIPAVRSVIQKELERPASAEELVKVLAVIEGSFKWPAGVVKNRDPFLSAMAEELKPYPFAVLAKAAQEARQTLNWLPSIAEMVKLCNKQRSRMRCRLAALEWMEFEHERLLDMRSDHSINL